VVQHLQSAGLRMSDYGYKVKAEWSFVKRLLNDSKCSQIATEI